MKSKSKSKAAKKGGKNYGGLKNVNHVTRETKAKTKGGKK